MIAHSKHFCNDNTYAEVLIKNSFCKRMKPLHRVGQLGIRWLRISVGKVARIFIWFCSSVGLQVKDLKTPGVDDKK